MLRVLHEPLRVDAALEPELKCSAGEVNSVSVRIEAMLAHAQLPPLHVAVRAVTENARSTGHNSPRSAKGTGACSMGSRNAKGYLRRPRPECILMRLPPWCDVWSSACFMIVPLLSNDRNDFMLWRRVHGMLHVSWPRDLNGGDTPPPATPASAAPDRYPSVRVTR